MLASLSIRIPLKKERAFGIQIYIHNSRGFPGDSVVNLPAHTGDTEDSGSIPGLVGKIPWSRKWQPLQYSCLENSMDRRVWWATVHETAKSWTQQAIEHTHTHTHTHIADSLCYTIEASTTL